LGSGGWNVEDTKGKIFVTYRQTDIGLLPAVKLKPELQMSLEGVNEKKRGVRKGRSFRWETNHL